MVCFVILSAITQLVIVSQKHVIRGTMEICRMLEIREKGLMKTTGLMLLNCHGLKKNQRFFELVLQGQSWIRKLHLINWGLNFKNHLENNLDLRRRERESHRQNCHLSTQSNLWLLTRRNKIYFYFPVLLYFLRRC